MKVKEFLYLLGLRPKARTFGHVVEEYHLEREGRVDVAQWQHPKAYRPVPLQVMVDQLRTFLRPGDMAIDIGAHIGDTALPMALAVGPTGIVLALEPNPYVFKILRANAQLNPEKVRIEPLMIAAMPADGEYTFDYCEPGHNNGGYHQGISKWRHGSAYPVLVQGRNLVDLLRQDYPDWIDRLRFIKVDAEGFDLNVLESIDEIIVAQRPVLAVEMFSLRKSDPEYRRRLYAYLVDRGYRVHHVESEERLFGEVVTPDNLMAWNDYDVMCVPIDP